MSKESVEFSNTMNNRRTIKPLPKTKRRMKIQLRP